jgi:formyl-CoA transferase
MSGLTYITGFPDRPPVHAGFPLADAIAGIYGAFAVLAALYHRDASGGEGQVIDLGLYEGVFRLLEFHYIAYDQLGHIYERYGNRHPYVAPSDTYRTKDGRWVSLTASTPSIWERLVKAMGREELLEDPRFLDNRARVEHTDEINAIVAEWIGQQTLEELTKIFQEHEVAFGPVFNMADIARDPHYQARENIIELEDPELGHVRMPGVVPKFSKTPGRVRWAGPRLGEHNEEIYCGLLGMNKEELERLQSEGVI